MDQEDAVEKMEETRRVWQIFKEGKYKIYISDIVMYEINKCNMQKKKDSVTLLGEYLEKNGKETPLCSII